MGDLYRAEHCATCQKPITYGGHAPIGSWCCRVWFYVEISTNPDGCWIWTGATNKHGYGFLSNPGNRNSNTLAHRALYELVNGPIGAGLVLMHSCDNPPCCNPSHLTPGTQAENVLDAWRKGRMKPPRGQRGEEHPAAVLTVEKVHLIRRLSADGISQVAIARQVGASRSAVGTVVRGERWVHVS